MSVLAYTAITYSLVGTHQQPFWLDGVPPDTAATSLLEMTFTKGICKSGGSSVRRDSFQPQCVLAISQHMIDTNYTWESAFGYYAEMSFRYFDKTNIEIVHFLHVVS